jgi:methylmalonyl-CoA mutase N-terminal domain/subunit
VTDTVDPFAGSYAVEHLTNEIERRAQEYMDRIDSLGGALRAIETGFIQKEIAESAYGHQRSVEAGETTIVGVNLFAAADTRPMKRLVVSPEVEKQQLAKLGRLREQRNQEKVDATLGHLVRAAEGTQNLMPAIEECVDSYVTLGEICGALREVFGEYQAPALL